MVDPFHETIMYFDMETIIDENSRNVGKAKGRKQTKGFKVFSFERNRRLQQHYFNAG